MSDSTLLLDVGNTRVKWACLNAGEFSEEGAGTHRGGSLRELVTSLPKAADSVWVASVAGEALNADLGALLNERYGHAPQFAQVRDRYLGLRVAYTRPRHLGVDRWLAMLAVLDTTNAQSTGDAWCIVDAGTAITVDALRADGEHLGGWILPGLSMIVASLRQDTGDIDTGFVAAQRTKGDPAAAFGRDTAAAVRNGSLHMACAAIERGFDLLDAAVPGSTTLILTGGDAERLATTLRHKVIIAPNLVVEGLALLAGD